MALDYALLVDLDLERDLDLEDLEALFFAEDLLLFLDVLPLAIIIKITFSNYKLELNHN